MLTSCHVASAGARGHVVVPGRKLDGVSRSEVHVKLEQEHTGTIGLTTATKAGSRSSGPLGGRPMRAVLGDLATSKLKKLYNNLSSPFSTCALGDPRTAI